MGEQREPPGQEPLHRLARPGREQLGVDRACRVVLGQTLVREAQVPARLGVGGLRPQYHVEHAPRVGKPVSRIVSLGQAEGELRVVRMLGYSGLEGGDVSEAGSAGTDATGGRASGACRADERDTYGQCGGEMRTAQTEPGRRSRV